MKHLIITITALALCLAVQAQNRLDDIGRISIHAYVPESECLPMESAKLLETRLSQIITANGIADNESFVRFVLAAKVNVLSKDIVAGPPQRISQKLEITLSLGDVEADKVYAQIRINALGIGQSEEKSYIAAFKNISPQSESIKRFLTEGKEKMLQYYQTNCEDLMLESKRLSSGQHYEDALLLLGSIPDVCSDCFEQAADLARTIYGEMIEVRGGELLEAASAAWANDPTREGAAEATRLLAQINFASSSQPKAAKLLEKITEKMNEIDRREWEHQMQVYQDGVEREKRHWAQHVREYEDRVETQREYLRACRDVAIAYARNQPKVVTRVVNYNRVVIW